MPSSRRLSLRIGKSRVEIAPKEGGGQVSDAPGSEEHAADLGAVAEAREPEAAEDHAIEDTQGTILLGEMLVDEGIIKQAQLDKAVATQQEKGGFLGRILVELGYCKEDQITACLAKQYHIPYYNLNEYDIDEATLSIIPSAVCKKYKIIPVDRMGPILTVALLAPFDKGALEAAQAACPELKVKPILCTYEQFISILDRIEKKTGDKGPSVLTMESLGISLMREPLPSSAPMRPSFPPSHCPKQEDSGYFDTADLAAIIQESMQKAVNELNAVFAKGAAPHAAAPSVTLEQLRPVLQAVLKESNKQILDEIAKGSAGASAGAPGVTREEVSAALRELLAAHQPAIDAGALGAAVGKSIQPLIEAQTQKALESIGQTSRSPESVAELNNIARGIQKEISTVMDELMNAFSSQLRPIMTLLKSDDKFERHEALVKSIYDNIKGLLESSQKDLGAQHAQLHDAVRQLHAALSDTQQRVDASAARFDGIEGALAKIGEDSGVTEAVHAVEARLGRLDEIAEQVQGLDELKARLLAEGGVEISGVQALDKKGTREQDEDSAIAQALSRDMDPSVFSFASYQAGEDSVETVAWCQHLAGKPGGGMPPLYLHGSPGTGKTHLVCATANEIQKKHPKLRVGYINSAQLAATYLDMLQQGSLEGLHAHFSHWDVLIIEDIQGLAHRPELQHELLQLLYVFTRNKRQLILTSTEPVTKLEGFDYRVQSHLSVCTCLRVGPPNWQQRLAILKRENEIIKAPLNDELLGLIAMNIPGNIRNLIGALHQAKAYAERRNIKLGNDHADDLIRHITQG